MKKNVNLKGIIIVLVIGFFSISVIKQVIVLKRIKSDISTQAQELEELKEKVNDYVFEYLKGKIKIVPAKYDQDAGIIGAAMQVFTSLSLGD